MPEEPTTPDLAALTRQAIESVAARDLDEAISHYGPDSVWDLSRAGLGEYTGIESIRHSFADWLGAYEELDTDIEEVVDLGGDVTLAVVHMHGRPGASTSHVSMHYASVTKWADGRIARVTNYLDLDQARAAAEQLAKERG
jgi:ketosteroid isomerase-like protein